MSTKQIYFQEDWLQNVQYSSWLKRKDDKKVAYYASTKCSANSIHGMSQLYQ